MDGKRSHSPSSLPLSLRQCAVGSDGPSFFPTHNIDGLARVNVVPLLPASPVAASDEGSLVEIPVSSVMHPLVTSSSSSVGCQSVLDPPQLLTGLVDVPVQAASPVDSSIYVSPQAGALLQNESGLGIVGTIRLRRGRTAVKQDAVNRPLPSGSLTAARVRLRNAQRSDPSASSTVLGSAQIVDSEVSHKRACFEQSNFGSPEVVCPYCGAYMWIEESVAKRAGDRAPLFSLCCKQGKVSLPPRRPTPPFLDALLDPNGGPLSQSFRANIRVYNSIFQFTSLGGCIDNSVNNGSGPYIFRLNHQTYHKIGPLLPPDGCRPRYAQLYIYDCANEVSNRVFSVTGVAKLFRMAKERIELEDNEPVRIRLFRSRGSDQRTYSLPRSAQLGGLIVGDFGRSDGDRDVIVEHRDHRLIHIGTVHPLYMALQYPILFPFGEDGFTPNMRYAGTSASAVSVRQTLSMRDYYAYQVQQRTRDGETLLRGGRLFQQFCVDTLSAVQEGELNWLKDHQNDIMADLYSNVRDLVHRGDTDVSGVGKRIILPASFTGSPRYLHQKYQDAMAICRAYGYPDLFITFTCNGNWPELTSALGFYPGLRAEDRPDLVSRVFHIKLRHLVDDLMKCGHFGPALAGSFLPRSLTKIEIPDQDRDPLGYDAVTSLMMHGPCGLANPRAPCMEGGKCDKYFPKQFTRCTKIDPQGYPTYRRRDSGVFCVKSGVVLDNRFVVPHNVDLLVRYQAHINVELCNQSRAIKYLFKYINKGPDRSRVVIESSPPSAPAASNPVPAELNEIKAYLDCRYLCAYESCWRLFCFEVHVQQPAVLRLLVHLPDRHTIYFQSRDSTDAVLSKRDANKTMFTEWLAANREHASARKLLYCEFPETFVWHADKKKWEPRRKGRCIGRVIQINACAGDLYYLRLLLNVVRGPKSYEEIRTVKGVLYDTFQAACKAAGLLGNDREWNDAMVEAAHSASPNVLRWLFVMIVVFCQVSNPSGFFERHWRIMADDIEYRMRLARRDPGFVIPEPQLRDLTLSSIEEILFRYGRSLADKNLPSPQDHTTCNSYDRLVLEEMSYDRAGLESDRSQLVGLLNDQQRVIFDFIVGSVNSDSGKMYFIHGHGGTGKTFLWKALLAEVRLSGYIAIAVASSGIASLLLPGGRTAHSRFKIPLHIDQWSTCDIKRGTQLARLIQRTSLIVWDEAPMMHRHCIEALDRSLRDIRGSVDPGLRDRPFGGITVVFDGDLRQILPVIPRASRSDVVCYTICNSPLWKYCQILHLTVNMRLTRPGLTPQMRSAMKVFGQWLLDVGDGAVPSLSGGDDCDGSLIEIPSDLLIEYTGDPIEAIVNEIYPTFCKNYADWSYLSQRAIVTPFNVVVDRINAFILDLLPGTAVDYYSCDRVSGSSFIDSGEISPYPVEFLNSLTSPGVPNHILKLKIGSIVMLLRKVNQMSGLCNGTRILIHDEDANANSLTRNVVYTEIPLDPEHEELFCVDEVNTTYIPLSMESAKQCLSEKQAKELRWMAQLTICSPCKRTLLSDYELNLSSDCKKWLFVLLKLPLAVVAISECMVGGLESGAGVRIHFAAGEC
ncbi:DNA helicase PIF1, ATP-dependent [Corchorus olitorius]|uniref:ATP-dependent DNA helicase n=1 Tax=Corchorus olitorius TaxID=93759 RepID=A0A1R3KGW6_9ROSI|nr:DNA helicase PIF1, ATP-dependent [Corchorus olitorius]